MSDTLEFNEIYQEVKGSMVSDGAEIGVRMKFDQCSI